MEITCSVKIILNSKSENSFSIRYSGDTDKVLVKIIITNIEKLHSLLDKVKNVLKPNYNWAISWNYKNIPRVIIEDNLFRIKMLEMFTSTNILKSPEKIPTNYTRGGDLKDLIVEKKHVELKSIPKLPNYIEPEIIERYAARILLHIQEYGHNPNFSDQGTTKKRSKIINYIKNALGDERIEDDICLCIANRISYKLDY
jgi:hypothetical protein